MARTRSPESIKAEQMYRAGMSLVDIANKLGKPEGTVRRWKSTQKWDGDNENESERSDSKANVRNDNRTGIKKAIAEDVAQVIDNPELTDKQRLFCLKYVRCFNATKAYQKAYSCSYETAMVEGSRFLRNPKIKDEIGRLKQNRLNREMLDESDIFQKYMDIAFADITDFVEFGREEVSVMGPFGPVEAKNEDTGEKEKVTKVVNTVRFKEHTEVDGTIITEVKQGRDGASIKLADRMKAMDWLAGHMDLATEEQRTRIDAMRVKAQLNETEEVVDDGFIAALAGSAAEDWADEED